MPNSAIEDASLPPGEGEPARRRSSKRLPDLASLYEEVDQPPGDPPTAPAPPPRRKSVDLSALYEEVDQTPDASMDQAAPRPGETAPVSVEPPAAPTPAPRRKLPNLSALYEEVDQTPAVGAGQVLPEVTGSSTTGPAALRRKLPDLSVLDDLQSTPSVPPPATRSPVLDADTDSAGLNIPPDLEKFISPDLWRKLNSPTPARGVLINVLDRLRSVFNLLSTFLPQHLVQEKMRRAVPGLVSGVMLRGTLLFSDVSGFTALSERLQALGPKGAEQMTGIMNRYFERMLEITARSGGVLLKFAGDAMLIYFPEQENDAQAGWAVRAGQRMLNAIGEFADLESPSGKVSLKMKIGVATGEFLAASVGSDRRMEYVVLGSAVAQTMTAESLTTAAGQLVVNALTVPCLDASLPLVTHKNGFFRLNRQAAPELDDFEIRAETRRARGAISWDASPRAILAQAEVALRQIQAILPYLSPEVVDRVVIHGQRNLFASQYRPTAVLFCNFWGLETLLSTWDGEGVSRVTGLLNAYFTAMNEVVTRYGGIISRIDPYSKGTKMLILFGAPVAHEDDPQRAVNAALAMNAELETLNETWRRKLARHLPETLSGSLIQHRIGITSGSTFAGQVGSPTRREYTVMGDEVNLSARLMGAAEAGQILLHLDPELHEQAAASFHLSPLSPIRVKGKSKPITLFQVQGPRDDLLANRARSRGALIGRKSELGRAESILSQALAGRGVILTLQGPAGIGKSHLADVLVQRAEAAGARVLFHACRSYAAATPYACWSLLLRSLAGITSTDFRPEVHHQKLHLLMQSLNLPERDDRPLAMLMGLKPPAQEANQEMTAEPPGGQDDDGETGALAAQIRQGRKKRQGSRLELWDQLESGPSTASGQTWQPITALLAGREREAVYGAVGSLLEALCKQQPCMIFFEDAHWMDGPSLDLLHWLGVRTRETPLLVLLAQRKSEERLATDMNPVLTLAPLAAEETSDLVAHLLIADLAQVIHEQSQGNPLFVEEITRWFRRTRHISADELRSVLQTSNFLQKLVLSGLESLPEALQEIALAASVIGTEFRTGEVGALLPASLDAVTLSNHLRALARSHLISLAEAGADARYIFQHGLVREILYNSLPFEKRRALHSLLADYLSRPLTRRSALQARLAAALDGSTAGPGQAVEIVAGHYEQAERWLAAAQHWQMAGDQARQNHDPAKAGRLYARALENLDRIPAGEIPPEGRALKVLLHMAQGDLAARAGEFLAATTAYEAARACLGSGAIPDGDTVDDRSAALAYRLALVLPTQRRTEEAETLLGGLLAQKGEKTPPEALAALAWLAHRAGKPDAQRWIAQCRERLGEVRGGQAVAGLLAALEGDWRGARDAYRAAGNIPGAALADLQASDQALAQGEANQAQADCERAYQAGLAAGEPLIAAMARYRQAEIDWRSGRADAAREMLAQAEALLEQSPASLAAEGISAIRRAYKIINLNRSTSWQFWLSQNTSDRFTIKVLFPAE